MLAVLLTSPIDPEDFQLEKAITTRLHLLLPAFVASTLTAHSDPAAPRYAGRQHSGASSILTTLEGANLPTSASGNDFPLVVRIDKEWFDLKQTNDHGDDIRFRAEAFAII